MKNLIEIFNKVPFDFWEQHIYKSRFNYYFNGIKLHCGH